MKKCPFCAEPIQDEAVKCRHCGEFLNKGTIAQVPWYFKTGFVVIALLSVGPFALPLVWFNPKYGIKTTVTVTVLVGAVTVWAWYVAQDLYSRLAEQLRLLGLM